jgi:hypothetical protein
MYIYASNQYVTDWVDYAQVTIVVVEVVVEGIRIY